MTKTFSMTDSKEQDKMTDTSNTKNSDTLRWVMIVGLVLVAFFGAYRFASARTGQVAKGSASAAGTVASAAAPATAKPAAGAPAAAGSGAACACCGSGSSAPTANGVTGPATTGVAALAGGVQKISVDVTTVYNPNTIKLKAGVPAEITFSQAQGCTGIVHSDDLGFSEDLSAGPKTVQLKGLAAGTYSFSCGMNMVFGKIVVE
jgi:plastocyanin